MKYNLPTESNRRQWKFELENDVWKVVNDRIYTEQQLRKAIIRLKPIAIFYSTSLWLEPRNIERTAYKYADKIWLGNPELVFDIDSDNLVNCAKISTKIKNYISTFPQYMFKEYHFTGCKGYRIIFKDNSKYKNIQDFSLQRKILTVSICNEIGQNYQDYAPFDHSITTDPYRIIRLPGSIHPKTGLKCKIISNPERHAKTMLMKPKIPQNNLKKAQQSGLRASSYLVLSTNIAKSKEQIFAATIRKDKFNSQIIDKLNLEGITYIVIYKLQNHFLIISPQKISLERYIKLLKLIKASNYKTVVKYKHYWVRISAILGTDIHKPEYFYLRLIGDEEVSYSHINELGLPHTNNMIKKYSEPIKNIVIKGPKTI